MVIQEYTQNSRASRQVHVRFATTSTFFFKKFLSELQKEGGNLDKKILEIKMD